MERNNNRSIQKKKNTFWKLVYVLLFVVGTLIFAVNFSMFYWPSIPSSPKPAEGIG